MEALEDRYSQNLDERDLSSQHSTEFEKTLEQYAVQAEQFLCQDSDNLMMFNMLRGIALLKIVVANAVHYLPGGGRAERSRSASVLSKAGDVMCLTGYGEAYRRPSQLFFMKHLLNNDATIII